MSLEGLADSGGCSTLAQCEYILALVEKHPGVLVRAHKFKEHQQGNIRIGGISGGIEITHLVEIKMAYRNSRGGTKMVVGLADDSPISMIYGLPFLLQADASMHFSDQVLEFKALNVNWKIWYKTPTSKNKKDVDKVKPRPPSPPPVSVPQVSFSGYDEHTE
jgi:hypothetical protein